MPPIHKLPNELVLEIMKHHILQAPHFSFDRTLSAIHVSQVCRSWRLVALDNSHLWAKVVNLSVPTRLLREVIIPRCMHRTINSITVPNIPDFFEEKKRNRLNLANHPDLIERLLLVAPLLNTRPKEIVINLPTQDWNMLNGCIFSQRELCQLEKLLVIRSDLDPFKADPNGAGFAIPALNNALQSAGSSWMLKSVGFQGCTTIIDSQAFSKVEHLVIQHLPEDIAYEPEDLLEALAHMTRLKVLKLESVTLTTGYQRRAARTLRDQAHGISIELPNLEQVHLATPIEDIRYFLYCMKTPAGCRFDVLADEYLKDDQDYDRLKRILRELERKTAPKAIPETPTSVYINLSKYAYMISVVEEEESEGRQHTNLRFSCRWDKFYGPFTFHSWVNADVFSKLHQLRHATCLKVDLPENVRWQDAAMLADILGPLHNVSVLEMCSTNYKFFLPHFTEPSQPDYLPSLKSIIFRKVNFSEEPQEGDPRDLGEILVDYVRGRRLFDDANTCSIQAIGIEKCIGLSEDTIVLLKQCGTDVIEMYD